MIPVTTKMSSRGQVVIPERIREQLSLEPGVEFVVVAKGDVLVLQRLSSPSWEQFDSLIRDARRQARFAGLTTRDIKRTVARSRSARWELSSTQTSLCQVFSSQVHRIEFCARGASNASESFILQPSSKNTGVC